MRGTFQGRAVAVKRLLKHFTVLAAREVALLQESDDHPGVIRYFCSEQRDNFLYIALELCACSLADLVERPATLTEPPGQFDAKDAILQIAGGVAHLHRLKIVHRDLKPQNVLVAKPRRPEDRLRMLISDFGLCKRLDLDASSFAQTVGNAGSAGWRAPEVLRGDVDVARPSTDPATVSDLDGSTLSAGDAPSGRLTRAIDIFSLGCIFHYTITTGGHPFGTRFERESNVLSGSASLVSLDNLGDETFEAQRLIASMIAAEPTARSVLAFVR